MNPSIGQMVDSLPRPQNEGYVAERHPLIATLLIVWAPCGCQWTGGTEGSFLTACGTPACDFKWEEVSSALLALERAEKQASQNGTTPIVAPVAVADVETTEEPGSQVPEEQIQEMISEGGPVA